MANRALTRRPRPSDVLVNALLSSARPAPIRRPHRAVEKFPSRAPACPNRGAADRHGVDGRDERGRIGEDPPMRSFVILSAACGALACTASAGASGFAGPDVLSALHGTWTSPRVGGVVRRLRHPRVSLRRRRGRWSLIFTHALDPGDDAPDLPIPHRRGVTRVGVCPRPPSRAPSTRSSTRIGSMSPLLTDRCPGGRSRGWAMGRVRPRPESRGRHLADPVAPLGARVGLRGGPRPTWRSAGRGCISGAVTGGQRPVHRDRTPTALLPARFVAR